MATEIRLKGEEIVVGNKEFYETLKLKLGDDADLVMSIIVLNDLRRSEFKGEEVKSIAKGMVARVLRRLVEIFEVTAMQRLDLLDPKNLSDILEGVGDLLSYATHAIANTISIAKKISDGLLPDEHFKVEDYVMSIFDNTVGKKYEEVIRNSPEGEY